MSTYDERIIAVQEERAGRIRALRAYFAGKLAEDKIDGTPFDCQVLDILEALENYWRGSTDNNFAALLEAIGG